jgi:RNA polymerase sigma-70 factor (ECF subfamily)
MNTPKRILVEQLFSEHGAALRAFFRRKIRIGHDAPDLAQEVYLRMLRLTDTDAIRNPELYLYTVANNLVKEHAAIERRGHTHHDIDGIDDITVERELAALPDIEGDIDSQLRAHRLHEVLAQLSPNCRAAVLLQYRDGLSYEDIAKRLGVSTHMVKKYLTQALGHCRRRMERLR